MSENGRIAKTIDTTAHEAAQQLQVIGLALAAIERRDGDRHAELQLAKHALEMLDRDLETLIALARRD